MQEDFHYYATYCASYLAGYSHEESQDIAYFAQFVDCCSQTFLSKVKGPRSAATTQLQLELMEAVTDVVGLQNITRIWSSFHFLPKDLYAKHEKRPKVYMDKYRLICGPNGDLVVDTVKLAKNASLQAVGVAMHVLADTWAHRSFAGTPSYVINNIRSYFYEVLEDGSERHIHFKHNPTASDDVFEGYYSGSMETDSEFSIMNLGHGRAGHFPDYSFARYKYIPAWGDYEIIEKDNPSEYYKAFCQMVYAMRYLRGDYETFETDKYDTEKVGPFEGRIREIIKKRQIIACDDWKAFAYELSGVEVEDFSISKYEEEYINSGRSDESTLGVFFIAAMAQKSMVSGKIFSSGNLLAGFAVDYNKKGFKGIRDFQKLIKSNWEKSDD